MPTAVGPNTKGEENLVFGYDTGDTANSYKGQPIHNIIRPLDEWFTHNRINIEEVSGSDWDSPVPGARMWKCYYSSSIANNSLTRDANTNGNPLLISGSFGKSLYLYSMWVRGFDTNPSNSNIGIDVHDRNNLSVGIADSQWKKLAVINSDHNDSYPDYLFHDLYINPTNSTKVDFLITGMMLARSSGSTYQELTPITNTNVQWLPEGAIREVDESLVDLTGNSTIDLTNVSFDSNAQIEFDGTDDQITHDRLQFLSSSSWTMSQVQSIDADAITSWQAFSGENRYVVGNSTNYGGYFMWHTSGLFWWYQSFDNPTTYGVPNLSLSGGNIFDRMAGNGYFTVDVTYNGGTNTMKVYINGIEEGSATPTWAPGLDRISFVKVGSSSSRRFNGKIPTQKLYNRALTASEIKANYNAIKGRFNI
jgi:hypothetical protein